MGKETCLYIITNQQNTTLHVGISDNIIACIVDHRTKRHEGSFTANHDLYKLVYYAFFSTETEAIAEAAILTVLPDAEKMRLITHANPYLDDLFITDRSILSAIQPNESQITDKAQKYRELVAVSLMNKGADKMQNDY